MAQRLLKFLSDGKWHSTAQIAQNLGVPFVEVEDVVEGLRESGVVECSQKTEEVRLSSWVKKFPSKVRVEENKIIVASIIMPSKSTLRIQEAAITNSMDIDLEIGIRINSKLKELTIDKLK